MPHLTLSTGIVRASYLPDETELAIEEGLAAPGSRMRRQTSAASPLGAAMSGRCGRCL
jgi:hypothetical protein